MSVIKYDLKYFMECANLMTENRICLMALEFSPDYAYYERCYTKVNNNNEFKSSKFKIGFIGRMMWYLYIANQICFSLQYQEQPKFDFDDSNIKNLKSISESELLKRLKSIRYNIITNDGNKFIEEKWCKPFDLILNKLKEEIQNEKKINY